MEAKKRVLVIDDERDNWLSAIETLGEKYEVLALSSFDEARKLLVPEPGLPAPKANFDFVLSDLLMPKGSNEKMSRTGRFFVDQEMGYGFVIAMLAAKASVPTIMVITDGNHHDHPMIYAFDFLNGYGKKFDAEEDFTINESKVMFRFCAGFTEKGGKDWGLMLAIALGEVKPEIPRGGTM